METMSSEGEKACVVMRVADAGVPIKTTNTRRERVPLTDLRGGAAASQAS